MPNLVTATNSGDHAKLHFVLVPFMAQGHMIPMIDMARLLADRGAFVTLVTTPINASRIEPIIAHVRDSALPVRFAVLPFPSAAAGLPHGCENVDALPSINLLSNFYAAAAMLQAPLIRRLRADRPPPSCIISDVNHPWTQAVAAEFGVPRFLFYGFGCFAQLAYYQIREHKIFDVITDDSQPVVVPGLPHRTELTKAQWPVFLPSQGLEKFSVEMRAGELAADGMVVNSFDELEPSYGEHYEKASGKKTWTIGPLSLYNRNLADMATRGNKAAIDEQRCLRWLDAMQPSSVLYVSFGSIALTNLEQTIELGLGLEASNKPFVWVLKAGTDAAKVEEWLAAGFEERTASRGLIIRGWAPQVMILSHASVGGFMTHCGWNSTLESVSAGVPMITWPHFAEQFLNEKLVVQVLEIGVALGVKASSTWGVESGDAEVRVKREEVEKAVVSLMGGGEEGKRMRERAKRLGEKAQKAMGEGGSSYENLSSLIQMVRDRDHMQKKETCFER